MAKKDGTLDLRIKRTQKAIKESFFFLVEEKGFEHISVKDITDRAMISRNTFYLHYEDKNDLLNKVCDELMRTLFFRTGKQIRRVQTREFTIESVATIIQKGVMTVIEDKEAYLTLFNSAEEILTTKIQNLMSFILNMIQENVKEINGCSAEYIISGMAGIVKYYVHHDVENLTEETMNFTILHLSGIINAVNNNHEEK